MGRLSELDKTDRRVVEPWLYPLTREDIAPYWYECGGDQEGLDILIAQQIAWQAPIDRPFWHPLLTSAMFLKELLEKYPPEPLAYLGTGHFKPAFPFWHPDLPEIEGEQSQGPGFHPLVYGTRTRLSDKPRDWKPFPW